MIRIIPWYESPDGGPLGRHVEHDPRSRSFPAVQERSVPRIPIRAALHVRHGKILTQAIGSCTGEAMVGALMTGPIYRANHNYGQAMAMKLYSRATHLDDVPGTYPPDDTGSSGLGVAKAALERKLIRGYAHAFSIYEALAALQRGPVITGVDWYEGFDDPDPLTGLVKVDGLIRGGHEFLVRQYRPGLTLDDALVGCDNSWGGAWGRHGSFWMSARVWADLLEAQGDVTCPLRLN